MNRSLIKIICIVTIFSMSLAFIIGSIAMAKSTEFLTEEIEEKIVTTAENYANDFSAEFNHMEGLTDALATYVETTFEPAEFRDGRKEYMEKYKSRLGEFIERNLHTIVRAHSLYVTFNPELTSDIDEVWYAEVNGKVQQIAADFKNNRRDFKLPYKEDMAYFFEPQGKDCGVWIKSYYDKDIEEKVFSYSRAIYVGGIFIGVAGADIVAKDMIDVVKNMKLYSGGYAALLDKNNEFAVTSENISAKEKKSFAEKLSDKEKPGRGEKSGSLSYDSGGRKMIMGFSQLDNGWTMAIAQPEEEVHAPLRDLTATMFILELVLGIVLIVFLTAFSQPFIKKQNTLEEENREKEIMLIYQSRQAKIGEMVGNVTHQWKQPLNTIKLIMANLLDSYRYGDLDEQRLEKSVGKVDHIVDKMSGTITDFSQFLKPTKEKEYFDISESIRSALSLMEESINYHKIRTEISFHGSGRCFGYGNEAVHVIFNVLNNARDAIVLSNPEERVIRIDVSADGEMLRADIFNYGDRIPEEAMDSLFEPYFTTKEASGGTGIGLYISREIIEGRMNGRIFMSNADQGVCCTVMIPVNGEKQGK